MKKFIHFFGLSLFLGFAFFINTVVGQVTINTIGVSATHADGLRVMINSVSVGNPDILFYPNGSHYVDFVDLVCANEVIEARWTAWQLDNSSTGISNVYFNFETNNYGVVTPQVPASNYKLIYRPGTTGPWTSISTAVGITPTEIVFNYVSIPARQSGYYTVATLNKTTSPLPIELVALSAKQDGNNVVINWTTASEVNNNGFEILKIIPGSDPIVVGFVAGAGNSNMMNSYSYVDKSACNFNGTILYQLKQIDYDGASELSQLLAVESKIKLSWSAYFSGSNLSINLSEPISGSIKLFDILGKEMLTDNFFGKEYQVGIDKKIKPGIYFVLIEHDNILEKKKIILY